MDPCVQWQHTLRAAALQADKHLTTKGMESSKAFLFFYFIFHFFSFPSNPLMGLLRRERTSAHLLLSVCSESPLTTSASPKERCIGVLIQSDWSHPERPFPVPGVEGRTTLSHCCGENSHYQPTILACAESCYGGRKPDPAISTSQL